MQRPIKLCIAALGGQGGGVLSEWLIEIAEAEGFLAQSTSVPGVAQRTGATIYYLEFFPRAEAERAGREPIMALMPVPGDVDCVVASELAEAGRAIQRGLVDRERTTLIASSHRSYSIVEKSAMGQGAADSAGLIELAGSQAKRLILFDMEAVAEGHGSVVSSVLLGAICGSGVLPFGRPAFEAAIAKSGISVATNLVAFADACERAQRGDVAAGSAPAQTADAAAGIPMAARSARLQPLLDRVRRLPQPVQALALEGARRTIDYQDPAYAALYLTRLERIGALDERDWALTAAVARGLALWMTFEDTIRVADLKTRAARFERVRAEVRAAPEQLFGITEFMKPRVAEIAGTLPAAIGAWVLASPRLSRWLGRLTGSRRIRTNTVCGFLLLHTLGGLKRWRRGTLRYAEENGRIEAWLGRIERLAPAHYDLAVELARAQRLIKGYGETHERGWKSFTALLSRLETLAARADGAAVLARLHEAALADEDGEALARELEGVPEGVLES
ncbi:MAG TPA: indolepyruvate oxidoreductase subunit beta family protein [Steroidobacteraceae bacterium]|jgi:indolepyruvate ferredoxin oxidoreductase beta subunit|nr:indolepyruvate oxidoreductase subunit beta family protein [Steroidobacteraceae bacterium]